MNRTTNQRIHLLLRQLLGDLRLREDLTAFCRVLLHLLDPVAFDVTRTDQHVLQRAQTEIIMRLIRQLLLAQTVTNKRT